MLLPLDTALFTDITKVYLRAMFVFSLEAYLTMTNVFSNGTSQILSRVVATVINFINVKKYCRQSWLM